MGRAIGCICDFLCLSVDLSVCLWQLAAKPKKWLLYGMAANNLAWWLVTVAWESSHVSLCVQRPDTLANHVSAVGVGYFEQTTTYTASTGNVLRSYLCVWSWGQWNRQADMHTRWQPIHICHWTWPSQSPHYRPAPLQRPDPASTANHTQSLTWPDLYTLCFKKSDDTLTFKK